MLYNFTYQILINTKDICTFACFLGERDSISDNAAGKAQANLLYKSYSKSGNILTQKITGAT